MPSQLNAPLKINYAVEKLHKNYILKSNNLIYEFKVK